MKTKTLLATLLTILCGLILSSKIMGQTADGYTSIDYDENSNVVDAYSETSLDYDVACDYSAYVQLQVVDDDFSQVASISAQDNGDTGFISVETQFYGEPSTNYTAEGTHKAWALYYDYDYDYLYRQYIFYYDTWFFGYYEQYSIYEPWYYSFMNQGFQNTRRNTRMVRLGTTHDSASASTPGAKPHHVVLEENMDQTTYNSCGSQMRIMKLRVVSAGGTAVPGVSVGEFFPDTNDTCNSSTTKPSSCRPTDGNTATFQDVTTVGCPITNSACGFSLIDRWQWCPSGGAPVTIAKFVKDVRPYSITINGSEHFTGHPSFFRK